MMRTEANQDYSFGFVLTEAELRRLVDVAKEQMQKSRVTSGTTSTEKYTIKFRNGAIATANDVEEVLEQENIGSSSIIRLKARFSFADEEENGATSIVFEFTNADEDRTPRTTSVSYSVSSNSRDWVFLTSSVLDERFKKLRRFAPNQVFGSRRGRLLTLYLLLVLMWIPMVTMTYSGSSGRGAELDQVEKDWKAGELTDPIEALLRLERKGSNSLGMRSWVFWSWPAGMLGLLLIWAFFLRYYPVYCFCWGDFVEVFARKEQIRRFVLKTVLVGLLLSILGGIIANFVRIK